MNGLSGKNFSGGLVFSNDKAFEKLRFARRLIKNEKFPLPCLHTITVAFPKLATTTSSGGLLSALQRAMLLLAPKGGIASTFTDPL